MTTGESSGIEPGWYPDPADATRLRRWDGQGWTTDVMPAPIEEPTAEPVVAEPVVAEPVAAEPEPFTPRADPSAWPQAGADDLPDWANVPGLTLPPDLSSIGITQAPALPQPRFDDPPRAEPEPPEPAPEPAPAPEPEPSLPVEPQPAPEPAPSTPPPLLSQAPEPPLRRDRTREPANDGPPPTPYAAPPTGVQYDVPPPPGVSYTPPAPEQVQPASTFERPAIRPIAPLPTVSAPVQPTVVAPVAVPKTRLAGATTPSSWLIALLPAFQFGLVYLLFDYLQFQLFPGLQYPFLIAPALFGLLFASADRKRLVVAGFPRVPSAVWAIVPPLYLLVRCFSVGVRSVPQLLVWIVLQAAAAYGVAVLLAAQLSAAVTSLPISF